jgi:hypothetical protein
MNYRVTLTNSAGGRLHYSYCAKFFCAYVGMIIQT